MTLRQSTLAIAALALAAFALVAWTAPQIGIARDEVVYMTYGDRYAEFWRMALTGKHPVNATTITNHFGGPNATDNNREHPPLMKLAYGVSHQAGTALGLAPLTAYRLPAWLMWAALMALIAAWVARAYDLATGLVAAALLTLMPRMLVHASLACFDVPLATLWLFTLYAYWRSLEAPRWAWLAGVGFGLALATKHNAFMLPAVVVLHFGWHAFQHGWPRTLLGWRPVWLPALLGPALLFALWPWLWLAPLAHVQAWLGFHAHHVHYNYEYLGRNWNAPPFPWHVPWVTLALTVPVPVLAAAALAPLLRRGLAPSTAPAATHASPVSLWICSSLVALAPFLWPTTPIFGAEKHYLVVLPTLAIAAAVTLRTLGHTLAAYYPVFGRYAFAGLATLMLVAQAHETWVAWPYPLSSYNGLAPGAAGGATLGMNRQYWGVAALGTLPYFRREAQGAGTLRVYTHDAAPAWGMYRRLGLLPANVIDAGHEQAGIDASDYALVIHERHFMRHDIMIWQSYGTTQPDWVLTHYGVPLLSVYKRPQRHPENR